MMEVGVNAATDVTGFGLLGHAYELAEASNVSLHLNAPIRSTAGSGVRIRHPGHRHPNPQGHPRPLWATT